MAPSLWQILVVVILLVLLFGRGKISGLMSDVAKGIKSFKRGMAEDETAAPPPQIGQEAAGVEPAAPSGTSHATPHGAHRA